MTRKKLLMLLGSLVLALMLVVPFIVACAPAPSPSPSPTSDSGEPVVLKGVTWSSNQTHMFENYYWDWFLERVYYRSNGNLVVDWIGGPEIAEINDQFEALKSGLYDLNLLWPPAYPDRVPEGPVMNITPGTLEGQLPSNAHRIIEESHAREGIKYLGKVSNYNPYNYWITKKISSIDEWNTLKICSAASQVVLCTDYLGAVSVNIPYADFHTSLERGVVDGCAYPPGPMISRGWIEVVDYYLWPPYNVTANILIMMNMDSWNNLSKEHQDILMGAVQDVGYDALRMNRGKISLSYQEVEEVYGVERIDIVTDPEDVAWWTNGYAYVLWHELKKNLTPERFAEVKAALEADDYPPPADI